MTPQPGTPQPGTPQATSAQAEPSPEATQTVSQVAITIEKAGRQLEFKKQLVRIGRDPNADIAFDPNTDLLVSFNHAKIVVVDGLATLYDLESTNGTYINGEQIARRDLVGGETVELGRGGPQLRIMLETSQVAAPKAGKATASQTVFGAVAPVADLSLGDDVPKIGEYPIKPTMTIGRSDSCDIVLDSMYVSSKHARLDQQGGDLQVSDAGSANGVFVGGEKVTSTAISIGGEFTIGPFVFKYGPSAIAVYDTRTSTWVDAFELTRTDAKTKRNFLDQISLKIQPREFVCILGPSGCGKSTLLKSLNGYTRADDGTVLLNNINFYNNYEQVKHQVGYVPQDDIIHPQLTIQRTLHYAAKLRLPPGTPKAKRQERIQDVLSMLELYDHRNKPVYKLSGGQRKRVSIAVELLTEPAIIYLDEPTSGLDPNLEEKMMILLRDLTLRGKTVVTVTHTLDNIHLADKVTFLVDGKLAFFGDADQARSFFGVEKLPDVYKRFEERRGNTDSLKEDFKASQIYADNIANQLSPELAAGATKPPKKGKRIGPGPFKQFWVLTQRYVEIITRDVKNTMILLIQAPLVALFVVLAVRSDQASLGPTSTMFLIMSLSALWFGCSNAAREITKEEAIYARERMVNMRVIPYVLSKFFVLQFLALIQVSMMLTIVYFLRSGFTLSEPPGPCVQYGIKACGMLILDGVPGSFFEHLGNLYLTALNGVGLGLLVSAIAGNSDKAMSLVPLILIPQVLFSGSFGIPKADEHIKRGVGYAMALNWSLDQSKRISMCTPEQESGPDGCTTCIHAYDGFKHKRLKKEDQPDDARCKALLPVMSSLVDFPETLMVVEDGLYTLPSDHDDGPARRAHKSYLGFIVQGAMVLLMLILVCIFMRLKDRHNR